MGRPLTKHEVVKHIAAIHVSNRISLLERKVSNVLLRHAWDNLEASEIHTINIRQLSDAVGFDSNDVEVLKNALRSLVGTLVEWNLFNQDKKNSWGVTAILASAVINEGTGICEYSYPAHIVPLLRNPNIFARLNLLIQRQFDSKYSLAFWEYATGQIYLSGDSGEAVVTPWLPVDTFHELLGCHEVVSAEEFKIFNRDILKPAISEINRISDIEITNTERQKEKRKITALRFSIVPKETYQLPLGIEAPLLLSDQRNPPALPTAVSEEKARIITSLIDRGIEEKVARGLVRGYGIDRITENFEWAVRQIETGRQIERPGGFIVSAIRRDFVAPERIKRKKVQQAKQMEQTKDERDAIIEKLKGNFWLYKIDIVKSRISALSAEDRERFDRDMENTNVFVTPARWEEYRHEGITDKREHAPLRGLFYGFAMSRLLTDEERDIAAYARSQEVGEPVIRELQAHIR